MAFVVGALVVVVVLQTALILGLLRSHGDILRRLHVLDGGRDEVAAPRPIDFRVRADLPQPSAAPGTVGDIAGAGLHDDVVVVSVVGVAHRTLLAFLSSSCLTCQTFWETFARERELGLPADVRLVVVTQDAAEESISTIRRLAPPQVPVVMSSAAWADYEVPGSPYFALVDGVTRRIVGEGTGVTWEQVRALLDQAGADADDDATEARIDRELLAAGVQPGDASLYQVARSPVGHERPDDLDPGSA
jgi:hypothetical protein